MFDVPTLTKYVTYARKCCHPKLTDVAKGASLSRVVTLLPQPFQ